jgi:hypothetical protein
MNPEAGGGLAAIRAFWLLLRRVSMTGIVQVPIGTLRTIKEDEEIANNS